MKLPCSPLWLRDGMTARAMSVKRNPVRRSGIMRQLALTMVGLGLVAAHTGDASDYLAAIGPAPLRFQKPALAASLALPPLLMHDPGPPHPEVVPTNSAPVDADPRPAAEAPASASAPALPPVPVATPTHAVDVVLPPPDLPPPARSDPDAPPILSPQMLLHFFNKWSGTNSVSTTTIVAPVEFIPPRPSAPPSSTSTYLSPTKTP